MANPFEQIKVQTASRDFVKYTLHGIKAGSDKPIVLHLAQAGEPNKPYFNALLRIQKQPDRVARSKRGAAGITYDTFPEQREEDKVLFSQHVVRGWENVMMNGEAVPCSPEQVMNLFNALPFDVMDDLRDFAKEPANFRETDVEGLAKN